MQACFSAVAYSIVLLVRVADFRRDSQFLAKLIRGSAPDLFAAVFVMRWSYYTRMNRQSNTQMNCFVYYFPTERRAKKNRLMGGLVRRCGRETPKRLPVCYQVSSITNRQTAKLASLTACLNVSLTFSENSIMVCSMKERPLKLQRPPLEVVGWWLRGVFPVYVR